MLDAHRNQIISAILVLVLIFCGGAGLGKLLKLVLDKKAEGKQDLAYICLSTYNTPEYKVVKGTLWCKRKLEWFEATDKWIEHVQNQQED